MIEATCILRRGALHLDVDFSASAHVVGLWGASGSGKTTFLHALAGLVRPASGEIRLDGETLDAPSRGVQLPAHRRRVGYVFQDNRLFPHFTVEQNLLAGFQHCAPGLRHAQPTEIYSLLDLRHLLPRLPASLSGGEARRVAIGRALLASPRLLILDEPMTGLDARRRDCLLGHLRRLARELPVQILYVSHTMADFLALVESAAVIHDGTLRVVGSPFQILANQPGAADEVDTLWEGVLAGPSGDSELVAVDVGPLRVIALPHRTHSPPGTPVQLAVAAYDVLLCRTPVTVMSMRNRFPARVAALRPAGDRVLVSLDVAVGVTLQSAVTPVAAAELELTVGAEVVACCKARAVRLTPMGLGRDGKRSGYIAR